MQCAVCGEKGCKRHNKTDRKETLQVRCYLVYWTRPYTSPPLLSLSFLPPSLVQPWDGFTVAETVDGALSEVGVCHSVCHHH